MSVGLRIIFIVASLLTAGFVLVKIRKSQFSISDTIFWLLFSLLLLVLSIFPQIPIFFAELIGFVSPSNFIFVMFIFLLVIKIFLLSLKISKLESKFTTLVQNEALRDEKNS